MTENRIFERVGKNLSVLGLAQIFTWISSFVLLLFLPKYLGSKEFGLLFVALSVREILSMIIDFGGSHRIPKEIARDPIGNRHVLSHYLMLRVLIWLLISAAILVVGRVFHFSDQVLPLVTIFLMANLFEGIAKTYRSYYQGIENMKIPSMTLITEKIMVSVFAIGFLLSGADALIMAVIFTAGSLLHMLILWTLSRKDLRYKRMSCNELSKKDVSRMGMFQKAVWDPAFTQSIRLAVPYFLWSLFSMIYFRIDALMLHAFSSEEVTGWYGAAYRFFDAVMILPAMLKVALFPVFSRLATEEGGRLEDIFEKSIRFTVLLAIPVGFCIYIASTWIIDFFMGLDQYEPSVVILKIFCFAIPMMFADFILGSLLIGSANRQSVWATVGFLAIMINVGLNMWLIPFFQVSFGNGGLGAAISTVITEFFILGSAVFLIPKSYYRRFRTGLYAQLLFTIIILMSVLWIMESAGIYWFIQSLITLLLFAVMIRVGNLISKSERNQLADFTRQHVGFQRSLRHQVYSDEGGDI